MLQRTVAGLLAGLGLAAVCAGGPQAAQAAEGIFQLKQPRTNNLKTQQRWSGAGQLGAGGAGKFNTGKFNVGNGSGGKFLPPKFDLGKPLGKGPIGKLPLPQGGIVQPGKKPGVVIDPAFGSPLPGRGPIQLPPGKLSPILDKLPPLANQPGIDPGNMPPPVFGPQRRPPFNPVPPLGPGVFEPKLPFDPTQPLIPRDPQVELSEDAFPPAQDPPGQENPPADEPPGENPPADENPPAEENPPGEEPPAEHPPHPPIWGGWGFPIVLPLPGGGQYYCDPVVAQPGAALALPGLAIVRPIDLELVEVRQLDRGNPAENLGPAFRLTLRERSGQAVAQAFQVTLVAALGRQPAADADFATLRVDGLAAGEPRSVDLRLSPRAYRLGTNADGQAVPFAWLIGVVDSQQEVEQSDRENDYAMLRRSEIAIVQ